MRPNLGELRVCVVDDNVQIGKLLCTLLSAYGVGSVRSFTDGFAALGAMQAEPPDILLCDWEMRPIDGPALVRRIRRIDSGALADLPIIMITGRTEDESADEARAAGVDRVVVKPIGARALLESISLVLACPAPTPRQAEADGLADFDDTAAEDGPGAGRPAAPMR